MIPEPFLLPVGANFVAKMESYVPMQAMVKYHDSDAWFDVQREGPGVYLARLTYYKGHKKFYLPGEITLIRGIRCWSGSFEDRILMNEIGSVIEDSITQEFIKIRQ